MQNNRARSASRVVVPLKIYDKLDNGRNSGVALAAAAFLGSVLLLVAAIATAQFTGRPFSQFTRDIAAIEGASPFKGVISTSGCLLWMASAAVALLPAYVLLATGERRGERRFLFLSAAFSALLMADDTFMMHEQAPELFGISEHALIGIYITIATAMFVAYRRIIAQSCWPLLAGAVALFSAAIAADQLHDLDLLNVKALAGDDLHYVLEDGLKFLGITAWFAFYLCVSTRVMVEEIVRGGRGPLATTRPRTRSRMTRPESRRAAVKHLAGRRSPVAGRRIRCGVA